MVRFLALHLPNTKNGDKQWKQTRYHNAASLEDCGDDRISEPLLGNLGAVNFQGKLCVEIEAYRPDKRRRDLDNLLKAALDACTSAGVWEDDSNIVDLRIYWADIIGGMIKVHVREL